MKEEVVYVLNNNNYYDCSSLNIKLYNGKIESIDSCLIKITFYSARGGETLLFGKVIKDQKPQSQNVVSFYQNATLIVELSYYDILKLNSVNYDTLKVYMNPL